MPRRVRKAKVPRRRSSYLRTGTLRLRHSWTRWLQTRQERRLAREIRRLGLLMELEELQKERIKAMQKALHPAQVVQMAPPVPEEWLQEATPEEQEQVRVLLTEGVPSQRPEVPQVVQPMEYPEEPMPDPVEEISLLLGRLPHQTSSPSSER